MAPLVWEACRSRKRAKVRTLGLLGIYAKLPPHGEDNRGTAVTNKPPIKDFSNLSDDQIDSWIDKYVTHSLTADPQCQLLFEERARRQSKVLKIEKSLEHLTRHARSKTFTTYGDLSAASDVIWN